MTKQDNLKDSIHINEIQKELGSAAKELMKPENLVGPFDNVEDLMKSLWDED